MFQGGMEFVGEGVAGAAASIAARASTLDHELGDDAMKAKAIVKVAFFFFAVGFVGEFLGAFGETNEILDGFGRFLFEEADDDIALRCFKNGVRRCGSCHGISFAGSLGMLPLFSKAKQTRAITSLFG